MDLIKDISKGKYWMEGKVFCPLFNIYIDLNFDEEVPMEYVEKCAQKLNSLDENIISAICKYSVDFCKDIIDDSDEDTYDNGLAKLTYTNDILRFIQPIALIVDNPQNIEIPTINLYCKCAWDSDNDMQILILNDKVVYVGPYDGLDPWQSNLSEWNNYAK